MFVTTEHAIYHNGILCEGSANRITDLLSERGEAFVVVRHSMDGSTCSEVFKFKGATLLEKVKLPVISKISALRYITEVFSTVFFFLLGLKERNLIWIGVDPLNAFSGLLLKKMGVVCKVVYFSLDFSYQRFQNKALNWIYLTMDRYCSVSADKVWNVSPRIQELRRGMGVLDENNLFVPNTPTGKYKRFLENHKQKNMLVTMGSLNDDQDFIGLFDALKELNTTRPVYLKLIGGGPMRSSYEKYVRDLGVGDKVIFTGQLPHMAALEETSYCGIGVALYAGVRSYDYFRDSVKAREYMRLGLPVVMTDLFSPSNEIREFSAGVICQRGKDWYAQAIATILDQYDAYSKNAIRLADKYEGVHQRVLDELYE